MKDEQRSNGLLQPMLSGQQRLLGSSEGDINQNMNLSSASSPSLLVDGNNNNSNSNDGLETSTNTGEEAGEDVRVIIPVDRRKSSVEPLQRHQVASQLLIDQVAVNGLGAGEDFEDIDGSSTEHEVSGNDGEEGMVASKGPLLKHHPQPSTPVGLCESTCG